jgi:hypothetical protein
MRRRPHETRAWLERGPSLAELQAAYPAEWTVVQRELAEIVPRGDLEELKAYVRRIAAAPPAAAARERSVSRSFAVIAGKLAPARGPIKRGLAGLVCNVIPREHRLRRCECRDRPPGKGVGAARG